MNNPAKQLAQRPVFYEDHEAFELASDIVNNYLDMRKSVPESSNTMMKYLFSDIPSADDYLNTGKHIEQEEQEEGLISSREVSLFFKVAFQCPTNILIF